MPLRSVFTHRSPSEEFQPRFRLVNLYATKLWRVRSTESIEKNVNGESDLLVIMVIMDVGLVFLVSIAAADFQARLIDALFPSRTAIQI
jgi:hypothetical protein